MNQIQKCYLFLKELANGYQIDRYFVNIRNLLFSIKGISSLEKVSKYDFSSFNKLFIKILLRG